jgi:hypothetical protein
MLMGGGLVRIGGEVGWLDYDKVGLPYPCPRLTIVVG